MRFDKRLKQMAKVLIEFQDDLQSLERIVQIKDTNAFLNKIRYITEGILLELSKKHEVSWGRGDPRMDKMLGPLRAAKVLPAPVYAHFRTIQNLTNPGSHFQEQQLNESHSEIAQLALIETLEWYAKEQNLQITTDINENQTTKKPRNWLYAIFVLLVAGVGFFAFQNIKQNELTPLKQQRAGPLLQEYSLNFSERHFKMTQLAQIFAGTGNEARILDEWKKYQTIVETYNTKRGVYRTDLKYIFGEELFLWEREIHLLLLYAGRNLECLYNKKGDSKILIQNVNQHLNKANAQYQEYKMTANQVIGGEINYPVPVTRKKTEVDQSLARPCN